MGAPICSRCNRFLTKGLHTVERGPFLADILYIVALIFFAAWLRFDFALWFAVLALAAGVAVWLDSLHRRRHHYWCEACGISIPAGKIENTGAPHTH